MKKWYEAHVRHARTNDEGVMKVATYRYLIEAVSYTDAETIINQLFEDGLVESGEGHGFSIQKISKSNISDVPFHFQNMLGVQAQQEANQSDEEEDDFDCAVNWAVRDSVDTVLVNSETAVDALHKMKWLYENLGIDSGGVQSIRKTKIENVFRKED